MDIIKEYFLSKLNNFPESFIDVLILLFTIGCMYFLWSTYDARGLPPCPSGAIPLFGHLKQIRMEPHRILSNWTNQHGPIYQLKFGQDLAIVLSSYDVIKEAFVTQGDNFSGRNVNTFLNKVTNKGHGLIQSEGPIWKEQRRFALSAMHDLGLGKKTLELRILDEIQVFLQTISAKKSKPFNIKDILNFSVLNVVCTLLFGERFEYNDPRLKKLLELIRLDTTNFQNANSLVFIPTLRFIPGKFRDGYLKLIQGFEAMINFSSELLEDHISTYDENSLRDFTDSFIYQMKEDESNGVFKSSFTKFQLLVSQRDLFQAGTETTFATLLWALLFMITYPEIQKKVQKEIDDVIGHNRLPSMADRTNLHYTEATILECQRRANVIYFGLIHTNFKETDLSGYRIPKRTLIFPCLWNVHRDPKYWPDPDRFDPERFLDNSGHVNSHINGFIPFGIGNRMCLGESLAKMELFLFFTSLLQRFTFITPDGYPKPSLEPVMGFILKPEPYDICIEER